MARELEIRTAPADSPKPSVEQNEALPERNEELCHDEEIEKECLLLYDQVAKGFSDQWERANSILDYWDIYNCELGPKQFYSGNSRIFVPIIKDAIDARKTRFTNQIFPMTGKNVEVISSDDVRPQAYMSLLEHYIRKARLRSTVVPALLKNGDVEGQYNVYMHWVENERYVAWRTWKTETSDLDSSFGMPTNPDLVAGSPQTLDKQQAIQKFDMDDEDVFEDIEEETIMHAYPLVEILSDADVLILPFTCSTVEEAIQCGGSVTVLRRYTKAKVEQMIADGEFDEDKGQTLLEHFKSKLPSQNPDKKRKIVEAAGIRGEGAEAVAFVYETWVNLTLKNKEGERERRLCRVRFGGEDLLLSCKRNPYWCDHVPIISAPADRTDGSAKGRSRIKSVETMQYAANDAINEGMDTAAYGLLPIVMTDPLKNPRTGTMVLNCAAVWETNPNDTKFAQFPQLWKDAIEIVNAFKNQIFQTLGVNPAMLPTSPQKGAKPSQAQIVQEQQVDLLMTSDAVIGISDDILTPILRWFVYLDHQYRNKPLTVRQFGKLGLEMEMDEIEPIQMDRRFEVRWFGVEAMRSVQQMQQQMAGLNVVRGIPPQQYKGYELNLAPVLAQFMENLFGPRLAKEIFTDMRSKLSLDAEFENSLLRAHFHVPVSPMDDDQNHIQSHMQLFQTEGDPSGYIREHLLLHSMNMQAKQQQQLMQQQPQGQPGVPGGAGPGVPGTPRQGARTGGPRGGQGPAGMIHQDQMPGAMPRLRGVR